MLRKLILEFCSLWIKLQYLISSYLESLQICEFCGDPVLLFMDWNWLKSPSWWFFYTIGSNIHKLHLWKNMNIFFSFRGHSYNRRKSVWTKYLGHCILYLNLSSYMKFSHFFLIYCICRNKTLFDRTTSLNGKKNTAIKAL